MSSSPAIATQVAADIKAASWIREMFEKGLKLKAELGADKVCDFSLGNPNATPPDAFFDAIDAVAAERNPVLHRYMPNVGFPDTRDAIARFLAAEYNVPISADGLVLTSGAAGGMNVAMRAICNPGDEVIVLAPFFPEYRFYVAQANARLVLAQTDDDFQPDLDAIAAAINDRTRAIIVNSPNNPTGVVYTEQRLRDLCALLAKNDRPERPLYLLLDDPYRRIIYDDQRPPTPLGRYPRTLLISSYSKDVSIPGERAGYVAVPDATPEKPTLMAALTMLNRTLGYVNMSALIQRVLARCANACCDLSTYRANRDLLCSALRDYGYELVQPGGALYAFPKTPIPDADFADALLKQNILVVPGSGFGRPGYIRISYAVETAVVERALPGFKAAMDAIQ